MKRGTRLAAAPALVWLLLAFNPPGVSAECMNVPLGPNDHLDVGVAFRATVTRASDQVDPNPIANPWDWRVELDLKETYLGSVPKALAFNDYATSCAGLNIGALRAGDEIIIATEAMPMSYLPQAPFEGDFVIWQKTEEGWALFEDALAYGSNPDFYPKAARAATTKAAILRVIAAASLPSTSTDPTSPTRDDPNRPLFIVLAVAAAFALALSRFRDPPGHSATRDIAHR